MFAPPGWLTFKELKSSPNAEPENTLLFAKKYAGQFLYKAASRVRIIRINQAKRYVDDRDLETELYAETGAYIGQF